MSDDLEKLAKELRHLQPSKSSRDAGMENAMAAFVSEFSSENISADATQGSTGDMRPTEQNTDTGSVDIFGRSFMSKFNQVFSFTPQSRWMMGSCAAAMLAALVILPNIRDVQDITDIRTTGETAVVETDATPAPETPVEVYDLGSKASLDNRTSTNDTFVEETPTNQNVETSKIRIGGKEDTGDRPKEATANSQGGISSIDNLLDKIKSDSDSLKVENQRRETEFRGSLQAQPPAAFIAENKSVETDSQAKEKQLPGGYTVEEIPAKIKTELKSIVTKEDIVEFVHIPQVFETVTETVVAQESRTEQVVIPAEYEWVDGILEGSTVEAVVIPAEYETVTEPVIVQEASTEIVHVPPVYNPDGTIATPASVRERVIPAVTKMEARRVVKRPARIVERTVPYETRDGKTRVAVKPATVQERVVPAVTKQVTRRVIKMPAASQERLIPAGTERKVHVITDSTPERFVLRNDYGQIVREFENRDQFDAYMSNPVTLVNEKPVSTFSVDVDTASYSFMRASLNRGQLPPPSAIRVEEMINYFPYDYEAPRSAKEPFKANVTVTPTPWNTHTKLMHIGIKGYVPPVSARKPANIVFLIDTSGSMNQPNKLPLLINSFKLMLGTLGEEDRVSIVTYAGSAGTVLEPTKATDKAKINEALNRLRAGGSTAGAAGLELAYNKAQENFVDDGINRVILATDGDFNVGFSSPDEMETFITKKRETGIFLSVLGFGMGNYNDHLMQSLAQNGNGVAAYIDTLSEANKVLGDAAGGALVTIAKDVKIQVEFNPATISEYRLIGYETRALKREDFNNDAVDAGEIGAGHTVTAIYEMTPAGSPAQSVDPLRYVTDDTPHTNGSNEYAFVKIRHKLPNADQSTLQTFPIGKDQETHLSRSSDDMRFATAVAAIGQKLRGETRLAGFSYDDVITLATEAKGDDPDGYRAEFVQLVKLIKGLDP